MRLIKNYLGSLIIPVLLFSCGRSIDSKDKSIELTHRGKIIRVDPLGVETEGAFFQSVKFIRLETQDSALIGKVRRVVVSQSKIYVADNSGIFVFDSVGKYISKVKREGDGPGQYKALTDFAIDTTNSLVEIMDNRSKKLFKYDLKGRLESERNIPVIAIGFTNSKNKYYFFSGNEINSQGPYSLMQVNSSNNFSIEASFFPITADDARYLHIRFPYHFYNFNDTIGFFKPLNDTIYSVSNKSVIPRYIVDFGEKRIDQSELFNRPIQDIVEFFRVLKSHEYAFNVANVIETKGHVLFTYHFKEKTFHVLFNKESGTVIQASRKTVDYLAGTRKSATPENFPMTTFNGKFIEVLEPYEFITTIDSLKKNLSIKDWQNFSSGNSEILKIYQTAKLDDNPILVVSVIREN